MKEGIEPSFPDSKSGVLTIRRHHHLKSTRIGPSLISNFGFGFLDSRFLRGFLFSTISVGFGSISILA